MSIIRGLAIVAIGYLIGSVSVAVLLTKLHFGRDVRSGGSGNAGATNVARVFGYGAGLGTLAGDVVKTVLSMFLGSLLAGGFGAALAGAGCLVGHCWPLYFGFKGGKGVSVSAAIAIFLDWRLTLILLSVFILVFLLCRRVSAGSIAACAGFAPVMLLLGSFAWYELALGVLITLLVWYVHRENISRLLRGTEPKFKTRSKQ